MLTLLGFAIPHKIQQTADLAKKFSTQAKMLDQIAGFHNTIGDRMITSQVVALISNARSHTRYCNASSCYSVR